VIYRTARQGWSAELSDAAIVRTSDEARALLTESIADDVGAIGAYIAPVEVKDSGAIKPGICVNISGYRASPSNFRFRHKATSDVRI